MTGLLEHLPYLAILVWLLAASLGLPIPEDIPLLTGGYLCHLGYANIYLMILFGMWGVLVGDCLLFGMGRRWGHQIVEHRILRRMINPSRLVMAERLFAQHGIKTSFIGRFLPGLRPMIFAAAGVMKVRIRTFALVNGLAACLSVPALVLLGKYFGHNFDQIKTDVRIASHGVALGVLVMGLVGLAIYLHRRQKRMMASVGLDHKIDRETLSQLPPGGQVEIPEPDPADSEPLVPPSQAPSPTPPPATDTTTPHCMV